MAEAPKLTIYPYEGPAKKTDIDFSRIGIDSVLQGLLAVKEGVSPSFSIPGIPGRDETELVVTADNVLEIEAAFRDCFSDSYPDLQTQSPSVWEQAGLSTHIETKGGDRVVLPNMGTLMGGASLNIYSDGRD